MSNLTKREIVLEIYRKTGYPQKQIVDTVQRTLDLIQAAVAQGRNVELRNFGVLEVQVRKQRIGRNPNRPADTVVIPERAVVKFKTGKILKQQLKKMDLEALKRRGQVEATEELDESNGEGERHTDGSAVGQHPLRQNAAANQPAPNAHKV
jgi:nucleoid DNA-binding protein